LSAGFGVTGIRETVLNETKSSARGLRALLRDPGGSYESANRFEVFQCNARIRMNTLDLANSWLRGGSYFECEENE
jgi:hypothetical protein